MIATDYIEAAEALNYPTDGPFAEELWRLCSSQHGLPVQDAVELYLACGYIPFSGYPLARTAKLARMTYEQLQQAFEHNPILIRLSEIS